MRRSAPAVIAFALALFAAPAQAHLASTGFGDFYDGIAHVLITPEDLLVALAVGLLAGQRGSRATRFAVIALPLAWLAGGLMGARWSPLPSQLVVLTTATFALTGALVALDARLRDAAIIAIAIAAGLLHGLANGPTMTPSGIGTQGLIGAVCAVAVLVLLLSSQVNALVPGWQRIAVRVAGSWIAASGLLMFGWLYHTAR
ncbi:HupE/UreJ family protein [Methyloversatilis thermotolerans]|uniref:HupE/UreJ family protein n=1 Tax=Methyloversatilis thermotolerans TaxID=1346290 RepID=UPI0003A48693|nr:HupE/UreJ family protein [Methyloversatilis thermotolerans]